MNKKNLAKASTTGALAVAAMAGLFSGMAHAAAPSSASIIGSTVNPSVVGLAGIYAVALAAEAGKHDCKGHNSCAGQGGCKTGDGGCKGKNSCKGKGGCATDK